MRKPDHSRRRTPLREEARDHDGRVPREPSWMGRERGGGGDGRDEPEGFGDQRLYSASVAVVTEDTSKLVFAARVVPSADEFRRHLRQRLGPAAAQFARVRRGFDDEDPIIGVLVTDRTHELLCRAALAPGSDMAASFDLWLEQRVGQTVIPAIDDDLPF